MELSKIKLYRITHIENIPHILQNGITHRNSENKNLFYKDIGDASLINTRNKRTIRIDNGEFISNNPKTVISLGDFIPFYFGVRMPMLYVAQHGGNFVQQPTSPADIVYLVCSLKGIVTSKFTFYFSDGHATDMLTSFYDKTKISEINDIIDWNAIKSAYWGGNENLDIKRKKQAEFLVLEDLPVDLIVGFGCYNEEARSKLISYGIAEDKISLSSKAYY